MEVLDDRFVFFEHFAYVSLLPSEFYFSDESACCMLTHTCPPLQAHGLQPWSQWLIILRFPSTWWIILFLLPSSFYFCVYFQQFYYESLSVYLTYSLISFLDVKLMLFIKLGTVSAIISSNIYPAHFYSPLLLELLLQIFLCAL